MITMQIHLEEYLRLRRALGFQLTWPGHVLPQFVTWLDSTGAQTITTEAAITWVRLSTAANPITLSHRLGAVRRFARYLRTIDPATEIPPTGLFGKQQRTAPYIYSPEEIGRLVQAARQLQQPLRAATHEALFGLLGASGMRVGEALRGRTPTRSSSPTWAPRCDTARCTPRSAPCSPRPGSPRQPAANPEFMI